MTKAVVAAKLLVAVKAAAAAAKAVETADFVDVSVLLVASNLVSRRYLHRKEECSLTLLRPIEDRWSLSFGLVFPLWTVLQKGGKLACWEQLVLIEGYAV